MDEALSRLLCSELSREARLRPGLKGDGHGPTSAGAFQRGFDRQPLANSTSLGMAEEVGEVLGDRPRVDPLGLL